MKQKKIVLGILLALVLLLGAAYLLYAKLGSSIAPNQLSAQGAQDSAVARRTQARSSRSRSLPGLYSL